MFAAALAGAATIVWVVRRRIPAGPEPLSGEEEARLAKIAERLD
jgi:cytochrome c-type biogenesis protein CcmH/NrfF